LANSSEHVVASRVHRRRSGETRVLRIRRTNEMRWDEMQRQGKMRSLTLALTGQGAVRPHSFDWRSTEWRAHVIVRVPHNVSWCCDAVSRNDATWSGPDAADVLLYRRRVSVDTSFALEELLLPSATSAEQQSSDESNRKIMYCSAMYTNTTGRKPSPFSFRFWFVQYTTISQKANWTYEHLHWPLMFILRDQCSLWLFPKLTFIYLFTYLLT